MASLTEIRNARISWLDSGQPYCDEYSDVYYSRQDGVKESEYVFLKANKLDSRLQQANQQGFTFTIAEIGFGTGLNFLLCWDLKRKLGLHDLKLRYLAFEKHPLTTADLKQALGLWPELRVYSDKLANQYTDHTAGIHRLSFGDNLILDIYYGDALESLQHRHSTSGNRIDCWFMDGFAPQHNPEVWSNALANLMYTNSNSEATVSTYSSAGQVKRALSEAGFLVTKQPGFGTKRHMLTARKTDAVDASSHACATIDPRARSPWFLVPDRPGGGRKAIVIGAGLAGCSTACSLAQRGWQVTIIDRENSLAMGASGNNQAVLQCRLAADQTARSQFYLHAFLFTHRQLNQLQESGAIHWHNCGVMLMLNADHSSLEKIRQHPGRFYSRTVASPLSRQQGSELAKAELTGESLWLPQGGWTNPARLCQAYLDQPFEFPVTLTTDTTIRSLEHSDGRWQVLDDNVIVDSADVVILANGFEAASIAQVEGIPLLPVRGQLSQLGSTSESARLATVVVSQRYICPADQGSHSIGASYSPNINTRHILAEDDEQTLQGISGIFKSDKLLGGKILTARASVRCNSADYFPVIGPVPDIASFRQEYAELGRNARAIPAGNGAYLPGLYLNTAHGSYGLATCPLGAEYLASLICNESPPLPVAQMDSLNPARFIIRSLKKQVFSG